MIKDQFYSFFKAKEIIDQFEIVLLKNGIRIVQGSELERLCLNVIDLVEKHLNPSLRYKNEDIRPFFRECLGLTDLITKIIKSSSHPNFQILLPYLRKLNDNNPLQNIKTSILNQYNNKLFELYIATLCLNLNVDSISIDDPDHSVGDNPDILVAINGKMWGFACKTLHSKKPMTIWDNIEKAVKQIESSNADVGIPILNIKNIIDHNLLWPELPNYGSEEKIFGAFTDIKKPWSIILEFVNKLNQNIVTHIGQDNINIVFEKRKSYPAVLFYCSSVTSIFKFGQPLPTRLNCFQLTTFGEIDDECKEVCSLLNHELQVVK